MPERELPHIQPDKLIQSRCARYLACRAGFDLGLMSLLPVLRACRHSMAPPEGTVAPSIPSGTTPLYRMVLPSLVPPGI